jgi:HEAT repeat protein
VDHCLLAKWIYKSQTSCYAKDRRKAIRYLGRHFNCQCSPEIMTAFIYALNDAVEDVREEAAVQIRYQVHKNGCCCSKEVVAALTAALGDCDKHVRRAAEKALEGCGYEVVKGCCRCVSCDPCSCNYGGPRNWMKGGVPPTPADKKAAPPAPGTQKVYFPATLRYSRPARSRARLANLFGLLD